MPQELVQRPEAVEAFEAQLGIYDQHLEAMLDGTGVGFARFKATAVEAVMRNPSILECTLPSRINAVMTAANFALPIDGVHSAIVKFADKAQWIGMYQGYVVLAGRGGFTLRGGVVRKGDIFDFDEPRGVVNHQRVLGDEDKRKITATWAVSTSNRFPPLAVVLSYDQILQARARSPQFKSKGERSVWGLDFDAMARKTPMRVLSKDIPFVPLQMMAAVETFADQVGRPSFMDQEGVLNVARPRDGDVIPPQVDATAEAEKALETPKYAVDMSDGSQRVFPSPERWRTFMMTTIEKLTPDQAAQFYENNGQRLADMNDIDPETAKAVDDAFHRKMGK